MAGTITSRATSMLLIMSGVLAVVTSPAAYRDSTYQTSRMCNSVAYSLSLYTMGASLLTFLLISKQRMFVVYHCLRYTAGWAFLFSVAFASAGGVVSPFSGQSTFVFTVSIIVCIALFIALCFTVRSTCASLGNQVKSEGFSVITLNYHHRFRLACSPRK